MEVGESHQRKLSYDKSLHGGLQVQAKLPVDILLESEDGLQVSSFSLSPYGDFVVIAFTSGVIRFYPFQAVDAFGELVHDTVFPQHVYSDGILLGHIQARGMYTALNIKVEVTQDGKFAFAGVYRGSTETIAFDIASIKNNMQQDKTCISYSYFDAKLKVL